MPITFPNDKWLVANGIGVVVTTLLYMVFVFVTFGRFDILEMCGLFVIYGVISLIDFYIYYESEFAEEQKTITQQLKDMRWTILATLFVYIAIAVYYLYTQRQSNAKIDEAYNLIAKSLASMKKTKKLNK